MNKKALVCMHFYPGFEWSFQVLSHFPRVFLYRAQVTWTQHHRSAWDVCGFSPRCLPCRGPQYSCTVWDAWQSPSMMVCSLCAESLSYVWLFRTPGTVTCQGPLSTGIPRQEYCSGLPCPSPGDFPHPGMKSRSSATWGAPWGYFKICVHASVHTQTF